MTVDNCSGQAQIKTSAFAPANVVYPPGTCQRARLPPAATTSCSTASCIHTLASSLDPGTLAAIAAACMQQQQLMRLWRACVQFRVACRAHHQHGVGDARAQVTHLVLFLRTFKHFKQQRCHLRNLARGASWLTSTSAGIRARFVHPSAASAVRCSARLKLQLLRISSSTPAISNPELSVERATCSCQLGSPGSAMQGCLCAT
jgi:hypothetical protein